MIPYGNGEMGNAEKQFSREQLTAGVNLAAEFNETPFDKPFQDLLNAIADKQNYETYMIKSVVTNFRSFPQELTSDKEVVQALSVLRTKLAGRQKALEE